MARHPLPDLCGNVLFTEEQIRDRVAALGTQISKDYGLSLLTFPSCYYFYCNIGILILCFPTV